MVHPSETAYVMASPLIAAYLVGVSCTFYPIQLMEDKFWRMDLHFYRRTRLFVVGVGGLCTAITLVADSVFFIADVRGRPSWAFLE